MRDGLIAGKPETDYPDTAEQAQIPSADVFGEPKGVFGKPETDYPDTVRAAFAKECGCE